MLVLTSWVRECARRYVDYHAHADRKIRAVAFIGVLGFAAFCVVWSHDLPRLHESMLLAGIGAGLCLILAASSWWPARARRYSVAFSYFTFLYCLPFFFTLMFLSNSSAGWQVATMAALICVLLLYDLLNAIFVLVIGSAAALAAYLLATHGGPIPADYWTTLPVLALALAAICGLVYGDSVVAREKLETAALVGSEVAHECRTPLTGIRFEVEGSERLLATLPSSPERERLVASHKRVRQHVSSANLVIDLLLSNVGQHQQGNLATERQHMGDVVATALERYPFKPRERQLIEADVAEDFEFRGSGLLMTHVLFNLMGNGLRAIEARGGDDNCLGIKLARGASMNSLIVSDTGEGIPADILSYVFVPFVSVQRPGVGTGLGLSFCRTIVEGCGGTITCRSTAKAGTTFTIALPVVTPDVAG